MNATLPLNTRARRWPRALGATALLLIVASLVLAVVLAGYVDGAREGFQLVIDDESIQLLPHGFEAGIGTVFGLMLAVLTVLVVVPAVLLLVAVLLVSVLGLVALAVGAGLAAAAAAIVLAFAFVTSPLWLVLLLMWWLLRRRPAPA